MQLKIKKTLVAFAIIILGSSAFAQDLSPNRGSVNRNTKVHFTQIHPSPCQKDKSDTIKVTNRIIHVQKGDKRIVLIESPESYLVETDTGSFLIDRIVGKRVEIQKVEDYCSWFEAVVNYSKMQSRLKKNGFTEVEASSANTFTNTNLKKKSGSIESKHNYTIHNATGSLMNWTYSQGKSSESVQIESMINSSFNSTQSRVSALFKQFPLHKTGSQTIDINQTTLATQIGACENSKGCLILLGDMSSLLSQNAFEAFCSAQFSGERYVLNINSDSDEKFKDLVCQTRFDGKTSTIAINDQSDADINQGPLLININPKGNTTSVIIWSGDYRTTIQKHLN